MVLHEVRKTIFKNVAGLEELGEQSFSTIYWCPELYLLGFI